MSYYINDIYFRELSHEAMVVRTSGDMVCSILEYSLELPVVDTWNRWFKRGKDLMTVFLPDGIDAFMALRLGIQVT